MPTQHRSDRTRSTTTSAATFNPAGWYVRATLAGGNPLVIVQPDGSRGLYTTTRSRRARPELKAVLAELRSNEPNDDNFRAVLAFLARVGRVIDARRSPAVTAGEAA